MDARLAPEHYLHHLESESARFRAVLAGCDPASRVPACPDWDASDLLWHLTGVQRFWTHVVTTRPAPPEEEEGGGSRPGTHDDLLAAFDTASAGLASALATARPQDEAWTWASGSEDHTVAFILRRQAHEALIHRLDAEQAAGKPSEVDARLAADGVREALEVMYGGCPPWGAFTPGDDLVRLDATDTGDEVWVRLGTFGGTDPRSGTTYADEADLQVIDPPGDDTEPDVVIDGPAAALDAWLWHRGGEDGLSVAGDRAVFTRFEAVVSTPIE